MARVLLAIFGLSSWCIQSLEEDDRRPALAAFHLGIGVLPLLVRSPVSAFKAG